MVQNRLSSQGVKVPDEFIISVYATVPHSSSSAHPLLLFLRSGAKRNKDIQDLIAQVCLFMDQYREAKEYGVKNLHTIPGFDPRECDVLAGALVLETVHLLEKMGVAPNVTFACFENAPIPNKGTFQKHLLKACAKITPGSPNINWVPYGKTGFDLIIWEIIKVPSILEFSFLNSMPSFLSHELSLLILLQIKSDLQDHISGFIPSPEQIFEECLWMFT